MRVFSFALFLLFAVTQTALAIAPIHLLSIRQAQLYGTSQASEALFVFLKPWMAYEERARQLNEEAERAYLFTPFLLIAMDAREKKLHDRPVALQDSEKIITDYLDTLSFSVKVYGAKREFSKDSTAVLVQGDKTVPAWSNSAPDAAESDAADRFAAQCYFYFDEKAIDPKEPVTLVVTTGDKWQHRFFFELATVK